MRLYTFINYYLSSIQQGIQTAHILGEMVKKHKTPGQREMLDDYLQNHKTIIVCNGGNSGAINDLLNFFEGQNDYLYASFREDNDSLNGALTGVGILVPSYIYESQLIEFEEERFYRDDKLGKAFFDNTNEYKLIRRIRSYRLAN